MKKLKRFSVIFTAIVMFAVCTLSLTACEDIKKLEVKIDANGSEYTLNVDLYRHLAPETCDAVIKNAKDGFYNNALLYKFADSVIATNCSLQIMMGDLKYSSGEVKYVDGNIPTVNGEFESNGVFGSNLLNKKGSIGLWRERYATDSSFSTSSKSRNSGKATWYMPTSSISSYDGYLCVFAQVDFDNSDNNTAFTAITDIFTSDDNYTEYVVFYAADEDGKLQGDPIFVEKSVYDEKYEAKEEDGVTTLTYEENTENKTLRVFKAEGDTFVSYNMHNLYLPIKDGNVTLSVKSVKVK